jgi:outer membrane protein OmpA-like peptidoglycan-associated protein
MKWIPAVAVVLMLAYPSLPAHSQDMSAKQMIDALQPKKTGLTRSLKATVPEVSEVDRQFIESLKGSTRSIVVTERAKLASVVQKYDMPRFDVEIYFEFNSANIAQQAIGTLVKLGQTLSDPSLERQSIIISGHTDSIGSSQYNQELSEARARRVKTFLVENFNISPSRLISVGFGEEQFKDPGMPDSGENRRVSIVNIVM